MKKMSVFFLFSQKSSKEIDKEIGSCCEMWFCNLGSCCCIHDAVDLHRKKCLYLSGTVGKAFEEEGMLELPVSGFGVILIC